MRSVKFLILYILFTQSVKGFAQEEEMLKEGEQDTVTNVLIDRELLLNKQAPHFKTTTIDGKLLDLSTEKILVINFWFMACGPCRKELPDLNKLVAANANRSDVRFVAMSNIDKIRSLQFIREKLQLKYELVAEAQSIANAYQIHYYPTNIVIDKTGKIVFVAVGYKADIQEQLQKVIDSL